MPSVQAWVDGSGLTLAELASIQPGYEAAMTLQWVPPSWDPAMGDPKLVDGSYAMHDPGGETRGEFRNHRMQGAWTRTDANNNVVGSGRLVNGAGIWRSAYADGKRMAEGPLAGNLPQGEWRFYHPSGKVAAVGGFDKGVRSGPWSFFYDVGVVGAVGVPIAEGSFEHGSVIGTWHHYDASGRLLATSRTETPASWGPGSFGGHLLDVEPAADGVHHWIHEGNIAGDFYRLDLLYDGRRQLYVRSSDGETYDADGNRLEKDADGWRATDCNWSAARRRAAHAGDLVTLHGLSYRDRYDSESSCTGKTKRVTRGDQIDRMLASVRAVRAQAPDFVRKLVLGETTVADTEPEDKDRVESAKDLARVLAGSMTWYIEFPHVDGRFLALAETLPGYGGARLR
jgi:hypothetical protein